MKHPQIRRARKVGEAVFRGANTLYTFEVFPLTTEIRDSAAVYIISRRITDRSKSAHHRTICVGEADSIVREIRKHKRAKCAKTNEANAVCILRENDCVARGKVIDDLVAARSFDCIRNVVKPIGKTIVTKSIKQKAVAESSQVKIITRTKSEALKSTAAKRSTGKPAGAPTNQASKRKRAPAKRSLNIPKSSVGSGSKQNGSRSRRSALRTFKSLAVSKAIASRPASRKKAA